MKKIRIREHYQKPEDATTEAMSRIFEEQETFQGEYEKAIEASRFKLKDICNHFDELISTTDNLNDLKQAVIDAKKLHKFYEEFNEDILQNDIKRLMSIVEDGNIRVEILKSSKSTETINAEKESTENPLIFDELFLHRFFASFDGYLWEQVSFETFNQEGNSVSQRNR